MATPPPRALRGRPLRPARPREVAKPALTERLFLIDGTSFCYRAFYAIKNLTTSKGQPTNAVYGVVAMLRKLLEEERPEYLGVAFDLAGPTFRHRQFEGYKKDRPSMPETLSSQIPVIKEVLRAFRIPIFEQAGVEADDILGALAVQGAKQGLKVILVTGDKDLFQLLGPQVAVYRPTREGHELINEETLVERWNLKPEQVVDVMALMGDAIDGIPGVPGIGEKTAVELIRRFGSVEALLKNLDQVPGEARRTAIAQHEDQVRMSRRLASLDTDLPMKLDLPSLKRTEPDRDALAHLFQELEFRKLLKEMVPQPEKSSAQINLLEAEGLPEILSRIRKEAGGGFALALAGEAGIGLSWGKGECASAVPEELALKVLKALLENPKGVKVCPQLKEALLVLVGKGIPFPDLSSLKESWTDPCLASYLLDPARPSHRMDALALEFLGESIEHPDPVQAAALAAQTALRLMPRFQEEIEKRSQVTLLREVEIPLSLVLARMEQRGIAVDLQELKRLSEQMSRTLERLTEKIHQEAGGSFNLNSPKQLAEIFFTRLKLPVFKRTKTGPSTDEGVLRRLSALHPLPAMILEYREMFKLSSTYVDALPRLVRPETGRIHTSFNQTVTATGRLSSSDPNLQNIPIRTEMGRQIRKAFIPSDSKSIFLAADYSQIELRILAHLSQDEQLMEAFRKGQDVHRVTAADIFSSQVESVTDPQRAVAKTINFGIVYGMSPYGLAKELGIDPSEAESFIQRYFARYHGVQSYLMRSLEEARRQGYCTTLFHRRRYLPELSSKEMAVRQFAERTAINTPIQGSAADLIKVAMVALEEAIGSRGLASRMLLQVHDELIFEVPRKEMEAMQKLVKEIMETPTLLGRPVRLSVPITVNLKAGRNWLEASH